MKLTKEEIKLNKVWNSLVQELLNNNVAIKSEGSLVLMDLDTGKELNWHEGKPTKITEELNNLVND